MYDEDGPERLFAIKPGFVSSSIGGRLDGATVVLMGCRVLSTDRMAEAFLRKGAASVVGWSDLVSGNHTDAATERLLQHLFVERLTVSVAVAQTKAEVGPDPYYNSVLLYYSADGESAKALP
jgi:hypothetical protein